jgi:2-desacetyl-2-hydroxyethyl bacteriochlorophyllide A dehydrogenase
MKAITIFGPNEIRMVETATPRPGPDEALVRVAYCGICGTDLAILGGEMSLVKSGAIKYPVRIGHEWSGIVEEVGAKVRRIRPGDRVVSESGVSCGTCPACLAGNYGGCRNARSVGTVNAWPGAFAEYMLMPERHLYALPEGIGLDEAALIEPATIALAGVDKIDFSSRPSVLVIGTGVIGLAAVALCRSFGASKVLLSGRKPSKLAIGRAMGADATINASSEGLLSFVMEQTGGLGVNAIIETSGNAAVIDSLPGIAAQKAVVPLIGFYEKKIDGFDIDAFVFKEIVLRGILGEYFIVPKVIELLAAGKLGLRETITHRFAFGEAVQAMLTAGERADTRIKMLVEIGGG